MDREQFSDRGYKRLFSHPRMVEDLIRSFVREDFVDDFDFSTLKSVSGSYVTEEFRKRESDIIWEVTLRERKAFIYILIEFQSTVDRFMAVRLLTYILLFYQQLAKRPGVKTLPSVFPIVLYNGDDPWTAPLSIEDLIQVPYQSMATFVPRFSYCKIAENEFSRESLEDMDHLVAALFLVETGEVQNLTSIVDRVAGVLRREADSDLRRNFTLWINRLFQKKGIDVDITELTEMEVQPMLLTKLERYEKDLKAEARAEGRAEALAEGRAEALAEGRAEGRAESLKLLLELKFGEQGRSLGDRVDRVKEASRLDELIRLVALGAELRAVQRELPRRARKKSR